MKNALKHLTCAALLAAALPASLAAVAAPTIALSPTLPVYGKPVAIELRDAPSTFMPATRYQRRGNAIDIDFEYHGNLFGPFPPSMGAIPVPLGELAPGNYTVNARLYDMDNPGSAPTVTTTNLPVVPPQEWGAYLVPQEPRAFEDVEVLVRSAAYFDPRTMRASVNGSTIRVDFVYLGDMPTSGAPAGMQTFGSVRVGGLAPGKYHVEVWASPSTGGVSQRYFTRDFVTDSQAYVVEYYNDALEHYFIAATREEIALLDAGGQGGWKRTGQRFRAWARAEDAPPGAVPVCRFYAKGPNSHFYTGDARECEQLKQVEKGARAIAEAERKQFVGWAYEGIGFHALLPRAGQCPAYTTPVYRTYNMRAQMMDANHRFMVDPAVRGSMAGWADEGAQFCSPS